MKKILLAGLIWAVSQFSAQALTPSQQIIIFSGGNAVVSTPQFFVASAGHGGSDSNPGTQASPWATIAKVNSSATAGSTVNFNGGDTFTTTTGITALVSVGQYGTGQAIISSGNSSPCLNQTNPSGLTYSGNIKCLGGGNTTNTTDGVLIVNNQTNSTNLAGPTINGWEVTGYGQNGIKIDATGVTGTSGFNNVLITNVNVHDNTGNTSTGNNTACIEVQSSAGYGKNNIHSNVTVQNSTVSNCTGTAGSGPHWSGQGIVISETQVGLIQNSIAHDFGANNTKCGGPVGMWAYDADQITIQFNEAYNGQSNYAAGGCDGDGFDLDGGVTNSVMQFNYSHDNVGDGYLFTAYNDTIVTTFNNNTIRYNIAQNNKLDGIHWTTANQGANATMTLAKAYGNTIYCGQPSTTTPPNPAGLCFNVSNVGGGGTISASSFLANNIFYSINGGTIIQVPLTGMQLTGNDYFCSLASATCAVTYSWNGTSYSTFSAWQTATGQEKVSGSNVGLTSNPLINAPGSGFTNGGYVPAMLAGYNLQAGSTMNGAGIDINAVYGENIGTKDYYGQTIGTKLVGAAAGNATSFTGSCTAGTNFVARMTTPTFQDQAIGNYLACALTNSGDLANLDFVHYFGFASSTNALLNIVSSSFNDSAVNSPTFTAGQGYTGNGINGAGAAYLSPASYIPSLGGTQYTLNGASLGTYLLNSRTTSSGGASMGANTAGNSAYVGIFPLTGTAAFYAINDATGGALIGVTNAQGFSLNIRTSSSASAFWKNGVNQFGASNASVQIPASIITTLAFNNATSQPTISPVDGSPDTVMIDFAGNGSVSPANLSAIFNNAALMKNQNVY